MGVDTLLSRLEVVKPNGRGKWLARCPAHQDRSPSLSLRELPDGRVLLHCFAGCETGDVLAAVGLEFRDVMGERIGGPEGKRRERPAFSAQDALRALTHESAVVAFVASDQAAGKPVDAEDAQRARIAAGRIADALEFVHGG